MTDRSEQLAARIRQAIVERRLIPGDRLPEREIVEAAGVSRVVVRQALIRLSEEGLVSWQANKGASVVQPDLSDIVAIFDALTLIERGVIEGLPDKRAGGTDDALRRHADAEAEHAARTGYDPEANVTAEFHLLLTRTCGNDLIINFHRKMVMRATLISSIYRVETRAMPLCYNHGKLLDLVEAGEIEQAKDLLKSHYAEVLRSYSMRIDRQETTTSIQAALAEH